MYVVGQVESRTVKSSKYFVSLYDSGYSVIILHTLGKFLRRIFREAAVPINISQLMLMLPTKVLSRSCYINK